MPFEWWIGRLCQEFACLPSAAYREWRTVPTGLLETILEYRGYAKAKEIYDGAETAEARRRLPDAPIFGLIQDIEFTLAHEALTAQADGKPADD